MTAERRTRGCHCKALRYAVTVDLDRVISCNCSHCSAKGLLLSFAPAAQFRLLEGQERLRDYQFNKRVIHHQFCDNCGVESLAHGKGPDGREIVRSMSAAWTAWCGSAELARRRVEQVTGCFGRMTE